MFPPMFVAELWRYPIKSMGGQRLEACELTEAGIPGDRVLQVRDERGHTITSRSRPRLLLHRCRIGDDGAPRVDERLWTDPAVARDVEAAVGAPARLVPSVGMDRFDVLPLLVATDGAIAALGYDARRFRPNIIIGGVDGMAERGWEGRRLGVGEAIIRAVDLRERCIMVTFDPDTAAQDVEVLKRIHRELDGTFALNCRIERPGAVRVGDPVTLL